jgi:hypothetical protein
MYRTHDFGASWTKISSGIRADDYTHVVREDPTRPGLLYAGTEHGIFVSWDDGANWHALGLNLPDTQVPDIVVEDHDVVIATHGRSMYVLDDISPIRAFNATIASTPSPVRAYSVRPAIRGVTDAVIQYTLARAADSVRVDILEAGGRVVRSFRGVPTPPKSDSARAADSTQAAARAASVRDTMIEPVGCETPRRRVGASNPTTNAGLNRFAWDLRYPGASTFPCMIMWSASPENGPIAVPGRYQVRVTAFNLGSPNQAATQSFAVRIDPRLNGVTIADLQKQFDLAARIRDKVSLANEAVLRIRRMRSQLAERSGRDASVASSARALSEKLRAIEEELYQVRNRSGQDPLNFPIKLNNRIAALGRSVQTGHARPTNSAFKVFEDLSRELDVVLQRLAVVEREEIAELNRLEAKGQPK